jgi:hypothetical protein
MVAMGDHYEDLLRFLAVCLPALKIDLPQSIHHADASVNILHHLDHTGLLVQLLTFFQNKNNRKKTNV